ncbi:hypothetical protein GC089_12115 [Cellulomonas sp. JZ18]|uniref:hypothetical protein n=1 Tax=Cellulomonas sp. JZ18 TaxID=2654191 RepID=UPI0012D415AE|nr:hypothetical protein [Cellulomonas sp. JZ18]QGQ19823.1 hypothetical protein GC089_12115 [Cellulomonas sp. JZ18]
MSTDYAAGQPGGASSGTGSATQTAKETAQTAQQEAAGVAQSAVDSGRTVAHEAKDQARQVTDEAKQQARSLFDQARTEVSDQAGAQQKRLADGLRGLGDELSRMTESSEGGLASDLARQLADRTSSAATWLDDRQPGDLVTAVSDFARRRPGVFLAVAAGAGLLAGRLTRGLSAAASDEGTSGGASQIPDTGVSGTTGAVGGTSAGYATGAGYAGAGLAGTAASGGTGAAYGDTGTAYGDTGLGAATTGPLPTGSVADDASTVAAGGEWGTPGVGSTEDEPEYLAASRAVYGETTATGDTGGGPAPVQSTPGGIPDDEQGVGGTATGEPWRGVEREDER